MKFTTEVMKFMKKIKQIFKYKKRNFQKFILKLIKLKYNSNFKKYKF